MFWFNNCDSLPIKSISTAYKSIERIVFTDASNYAADDVLLQEKNQAVHVMFNNHEKQQSSTFRELKAIEFVLKSLSSKLDRKHVKLYTDNQNVVRIVNTGSMKIDLQKIAFSIFELCVKSCIFLDIAWIIKHRGRFTQ